MKCKFCGNESNLIEAHVIPAGFFRRIKQQDKRALEIITNRAGECTKKAPLGVYDKTIVCYSCERIWQEWDNYAQQLLADKPLNGRARYHDGKKICYIVDNFDYRKLKLFFISVTWRASVSSHQFFSRISLDQFEDIAKQHIMNVDPGEREDFSIVVSKFNHPLAKGIFDPYMYQNSGVKYIRFYLASYMADIKVDHKPTPNRLSKLTMAENRPLYIICRDFEESKELILAKKLISNSPIRKNTK